MRAVNKNKIIINKMILHIILIFSTIIVLIPLLWALSSSFKPLDDIFIFPVKWLPENFTFKNYVEGWNAANFSRYFFNSALVTVITTISVVLFSSLTGFSISKYRYPGRRILFAVVIATMTIPIQVRVIPLYLIVKNFGWLNSYYALIVPYLLTSIGVIIMTQFIRFIPNELFSSARIDGCSEIGIFYKILLPLSKPGLAALVIVNYMAVWNDYFWPLVVVDSDKLRTLALGLATFQGEYYTEYGQFFSVSLIVILPMIILFLIFQKSFIQSTALSGIKG
ncbi:MAG: ABC transporter permease subunit [Candidatus Lokiarchaeota archaeon]|nr:ABC transporter permease subunit [Candidatus Lokiarchaeota archaeon]